MCPWRLGDNAAAPCRARALWFRPQTEGIGEHCVFNSIFTPFALPKRCFQLVTVALLSSEPHSFQTLPKMLFGLCLHR